MDKTLTAWLELIAELANEEECECYLVGGFLRDLHIKRSNKDLDFAVSKNPRKLAQKFADKLHYSFVTLHEEEQIYRVVSKDGILFDFAKFKGATIEADLTLRDFSINAMALLIVPDNAKTFSLENILDPTHGRTDLNKKTVRQISKTIYGEDPLRLLRAFRIATQLQFEIDPETFKTIKENSPLIKRVAMERIREELLLLLDCQNAYSSILKLDEAGLISQIFPEVDPNRTCALDYYPEKGVWGHSLDALNCLEWIFQNLSAEFQQDHEKLKAFLFNESGNSGEKSWAALMKLGVLLHDVGKAPTAQMIEGRLRFYEHQNVGAKLAKKAAERLKFSSDASKNLSRMVLEHMRPGGLAFAPVLTDRARFRFFRDLGVNAIPTLIVSLADRYTYLTQEARGKGADVHEKLVKDFVRWYFLKVEATARKKEPLINGTILMEKLKLPPSPTIGTLLKEIEEAAAVGEVRTQEEALNFARKLLKN